MSTQPCKHCGEAFPLRPQNPNQTFCSKPKCQRARKRIWQKQKLQSDPDYRDNQRASQQKWRDKNPGYWKRWRDGHPEYVAHNRKLQMERNRTARGAVDASMFAKMDASIEVFSLPSGTYRVMPVDCKDGRVNSGFICEISQLPGLTANSRDCKERTLSPSG